MKTFSKVYISVLTLTLFLFSCQTNKNEQIKTGGAEVVSFKVLPFELTDVKLLDGPFKHATELNIKSLLNYEPDRFLARFRTVAGLKPKDEPYGGWEAKTLAGHSLGHYLSACALMYQTTGDNVFMKRVNYIVDELDECQKANGKGFIGAVPGVQKIFEEEVAKGDIRAKGFDLNGIWSPIYTMHKEMAGLLDAYSLCGNQKALEVAQKFADWLKGIIDQLNEKQMQEMLHCEFGGINESLANLYAITGDQKYLDHARRFYPKRRLDSLAEGIDDLAGKHANTQIPIIIGLARIHELTGDATDQKIAKFFWDRVVNHHSYVTGGSGNYEYYGPPDSLRNHLSQETTESCVVYNMLKLTRHLFEWTASPQMVDYYERALFNHILSSQNHEDGRVIYNLSLKMGGYKVYQDPYSFTCCVGTGMENHSKYARNIYFYNKNELYVSQYIASELNWKDKDVKVIQKTFYPDEQSSKFTIETGKPVKFTLKVRYPYWAEKGMEIYINDKKYNIKEKPESFVGITRKWKTGDEVDVKIPFSLRLETMPDDQNRVAIMYGPLVMAGDLGKIQDKNANDPMYVPVLCTDDRNPADWLIPVEGKINTFKMLKVGRPRDIIIRPFYEIMYRRYTVYFDILSRQDCEKL